MRTSGGGSDGQTDVKAPSPCGIIQEFIVRVKQKDKDAFYIGRRYGDFAHLLKAVRTELPGKVLPVLPRKMKHSTKSGSLAVANDDDASSVSSLSTQGTAVDDTGSFRGLLGNRRPPSNDRSPRVSVEAPRPSAILYREEQRVSLRAFLRTLLQNPRIAQTNAIREFLTRSPVITLNEEEREDIKRRKAMDMRRLEEQAKFYEIARQRAKELDIYMEQFRREIIENSESRIRGIDHTPFSSGPGGRGRELTLLRWLDELVPGDS